MQICTQIYSVCVCASQSFVYSQNSKSWKRCAKIPPLEMVMSVLEKKKRDKSGSIFSNNSSRSFGCHAPDTCKVYISILFLFSSAFSFSLSYFVLTYLSTVTFSPSLCTFSPPLSLVCLSCIYTLMRHVPTTSGTPENVWNRFPA